VIDLIDFDYRGLTGDIITKEEFSYEEERKAWNRAIEKYPLAIVYCHTNDDIINAITWAKLHSVEIRIRSGRHHYEGYSTGNDVLVIDISKMNAVSVDEEIGIVKIQGGVRNRELYEVLGELGYPFPGGGCPTVGVSGLTLGGGWGYSNRLLGLASDNLLEIELIDYKGERIVATDKSNTDLFWALRGAGGGNFGVVTSMIFKLPEKIKMATLIDIDYIGADDHEILDIFEIWTHLYMNLDKRVNLKMGIYNSEIKGRGARITGIVYGSREEAEVILSDFKNISKKGVFDFNYISVLDVNRRIQDGHPPYEKYKSAGRFVYKDYSRSEMKKIIELVEERAKGAVYAAVSLYGLGGAIMEKDKNDTAFYYRDAKFIMGFQSVWEEAEYAPMNIEWVKEKLKYINSITTGSYINFPCADIEGYEKEYYGENLEKLREVKLKYDPYEVFKFPQGIRIGSGQNLN
jgi:FAD/FMN-containing dehydrogenases